MDKNKNVNLHFKEVSDAHVIRFGEAEVIPPKTRPEYSGNIEAPADFWEAKHPMFMEPAAANHIKFPGAIAVVCFSAGTIDLCCDDRNPLAPRVTGTLKPFPELTDFNINADHTYSIDQLKKLIRRTRYWFPDKDEHEQVLDGLQQFKASTSGKVTDADDKRGNLTKSFQKETKLDKPITFKLEIPLFVNSEPKTFTVEVLPDVTDDRVALRLDSPGLYELQLTEKKRLLAAATKTFDETGLCVIHQ